MTTATQVLNAQIDPYVAMASRSVEHRILIAEDNRTNRLLLNTLLDNYGFEIQDAVDGQAAIELWQRWQPHLILMDMHMPIVDGYEATQKIRELEQLRPTNQASTKIIALTASAFTEQRQESLSAGCDDFISKPFQQEELLKAIFRHLGVTDLDPAVAAQSVRNSTYYFDRNIHSTALAALPSEWIVQMCFAAAQGNDAASLDLIAQIPAEQQALIQELTHLVESYQFDSIPKLIQPASARRCRTEH
ncbi:MAG: response regulator [Leptolyngbyaceae cyanobacterium SM1_3_5]|nr:response regulator [Leptolyngbyaceae cyanobacterium SM1_3_5]